VNNHGRDRTDTLTGAAKIEARPPPRPVPAPDALRR